MTPKDCPNWQRCNAPVCPLSDEWAQLKYFKGEPVCRWLREYSKDGGEARLSGCVSLKMAQRVAMVHADVLLRPDALKKALIRASHSNTRMLNTLHLHGACNVT